MDGPREVPFHESANRPQLLMGGDRELILVSAILAAMLVFAVMKWWSILAGARVVANRGGSSRAYGEGRSASAPRLHQTHPLSKFLSREKSDVCSSDDDTSEVEVNDAIG